MKKENLELRMYSMCLYQLSDKQKIIQSYHSTIEATVNFGKKHSIDEEQFKDWAKNWKTVIILDGGTTVTLGNHYDTLVDNGIKVSKFHESDLDNILTAISFIVDERVFNRIKYPDYINHDLEYKNHKGIIGLSSCDISYNDMEYNIWLESVGGKENAFLRDFLKNFKLA